MTCKYILLTGLVLQHAVLWDGYEVTYQTASFKRQQLNAYYKQQQILLIHCKT